MASAEFAETRSGRKAVGEEAEVDAGAAPPHLGEWLPVMNFAKVGGVRPIKLGEIELAHFAGEFPGLQQAESLLGFHQFVLAPAMKVLPRMRGWFPDAFIAGWKYELTGSRDDAFSRAWKQLRDCQTDACVLNGAAYGDGFLPSAMRAEEGKRVPTPPALCEALLGLLVPHDHRERDVRIEPQPDCPLALTQQMRAQLERLPLGALDTPVRARDEVSYARETRR